MHFTKVAIAAAAAGSAMGATSLCDKYTMALLNGNTGKDQLTVLSLLVNTAVIGNFTGPGTKQASLPGSKVAVPGILNPNATYMGMPVNLLQYFDGSLVSTNNNGMPVSVNFLDGGGATPIEAEPTSSGAMGSNQYTLLTHLYSYFGVLLGCSQVGMTGFPAYGGSNSQFNVHRFMDLSATEFTYFVQQVGLAAESFGVTSDDVTTVANALNSTFGYKCSPPATVVPGTPAELQAICVGDGCPTASNAACSSYPAESMAASATMSSSMTGSMSASMTAAPTGASSSASGAAGEKTDGQPTVTAISSAGAVATAIPAVAAGLAGFAALVL